MSWSGLTAVWNCSPLDTSVPLCQRGDGSSGLSLYTHKSFYIHRCWCWWSGRLRLRGGSSYKIVYINQYPQFHGVMVSTLKSQWNTKYLDAGNNYFYHHLFYLINSIALNNG